MSVDAGVLVGRRSRGEIARLVALYGSSGMGRTEFCRSHGLAFSTLGRHLRKQRSNSSESRSKGVEQGRLMPVEVAAPVASIAADKLSAAAILLSIQGRRVEVGRGFDAATLAELVTVLEKL
jgi:transposase-like protein